MSVLASPKTAEESDEDLLAAIDLLREDQSREGKRDFEDAWVVLMSRHEKYLFGILVRVISEDAPVSREDVYRLTCARIIEKAGKFEATADDEDSKRKQLRAWMGQLAVRVFQEELARLKKGGLNARGFGEGEEESLEDPNSGPRPVGRNQELLEWMRGAMKEVLTEKEQEVLKMTMMFIPAEEGKQQRRSGEEVQEACEYLKTTPENIRKIKSRALEKLKKAAAENELQTDKHE